MKNYVIAFLLSLAFNACDSHAQTTKPLSPQAFEEKIKKEKVQVLDVRTADEFRKGHIKGALQADWWNSKEFEDRTQHLDHSVPVMVYCASGGRSASAAEALRKKGYSVYDLEGGMTNWKKQALPVEGAAETAQYTMDDFNKLVTQADVVLVDFGAEWCPPCRKMEPVLKQLQSDLAGKFTLVKIDGGVHTTLMNQLNVGSLPHFLVYKKGQQTFSKQGIMSLDELKKALQ
ncbi:thioredoxin domain-containing protein [Flavihumibacter rivuli]|uniref:rhodanese-like domain-containing protein n=1 Tax=Flavihumibacter rivuli TaxID=2838156 RepID=UPI001BDEEE16|nr:rhodanese-like domain-containing protein [Flavihumibacter rivuli]ULQ57483.1 thioredoxin domain-containing protein [Flavihumibacter rivuli]